MTTHEQEMLNEIQELQIRLSQAEKARLLWKMLTILCIIGLLAFAWWHFFG